jgi:DNA gyrase subunit A
MILGTSGIHAAYRPEGAARRAREKRTSSSFPKTRARSSSPEISYQVKQSALVEKIAELVHEKRLEGISDLREESDRKGMRIVIELKQNVNANVVLNALYKHTQMQDTFGVIMLAL